MRPVSLRYLPASCVARSVRSAARSAAMEAGVAVESSITARGCVTVEIAVATTVAHVAVESTLRAANIRVSMEVLETCTAARRSCSMEVPALEAVESGTCVAAVSFMTAEALPSSAADAVIAPSIPVVEIPPAVMLVEIEPGTIVERKHRPAVERGAVESMEPWARSDEHSARKPFRAVVAVRCARVRRIGIVAIGANRRRTHNNRCWAYANPN